MAASAAESIDSIREIAARHVCKKAFVDTYLEAMVSETAADQMDRLHPGASRDDRITVTTIHRSKGDEYKGVILFHVVEDILPHRRMTGSEADVEEERRVFYVALTRAEERLCITTQRKHPSRFLAEMKPDGGGNRLSHASADGCRRGLFPIFCVVCYLDPPAASTGQVSSPSGVRTT